MDHLEHTPTRLPNVAFTLGQGLLLGLLLVSGPIGCRKHTPVAEVSTAESGIEIKDLASAISESDWNQWRGSDGSGVATDQELPTRWSSNENIAWSVDVPGRGHSSPIVVGDLVVVGTAIDQEQKQSVLAFDRVTGDQRWNTVVHQGNFPNQRDIHQKATNANCTVASDGNLFVTAHLNNERIFVTALNSSGDIVWQKEVGAFASKFGYAPSPAIYKSLVIIAADNLGGGYLAALDLQTGEIAWRRSRGNASSYSSPRIVNAGGKDQLLISGGNRLASYDPATGEPNWEKEAISEATCGTVVTAGDKIFASGGYPEKETVCFSADGQRLWSDRNKLYEPSLITDGTALYGVTDDGIAICWSLADGSVEWRKRLGGNFSSSPVICNAMVYSADLSGNVFVFKASPEGYQQVAKNRLGDDCYASPAISQSSLFYRVGFGSGRDRHEKLICIASSTQQ